jgi:hypothetical protein
MVELNVKLLSIVDALPNLHPDRKVELATAAHLEDWTEQKDVLSALHAYFTTPEDVNTSLLVMARLISLLGQLVKDKTINLTTADAVSNPSSLLTRNNVRLITMQGPGPDVYKN